MKSEKVCVHSDQSHIEKTQLELNKAREAMQSLLNEWHKLEIGECPNIYDLLMNPEQVYKSAIDKLVEVPASVGRFATKKASVLDSLVLPDPSQLYTIAKSIRHIPHCINPAWSIIDNLVVMDGEVEMDLVNSQNIYTDNPAKIQLFKDLQKLCDIYNKVNRSLRGELLEQTPWSYNFFRGKFELKQKAYNSFYEISVNPGWIRDLIK